MGAEGQGWVTSLVQDDPAFRVQRALGLIPREGLGTGRRVVFFALLTWLPIALWALYTGRAFSGAVAEPLIRHFGIHARLLVALPLLIVCEAIAHQRTELLIPQFLRSGVVPEERRERFGGIIQEIAGLRRRVLPWFVILAVVVLATLLGKAGAGSHEVIWAAEGEGGSARIGFGGLWLLYVARPVFLLFACAWLWRMVLLSMLLRRISRLDLELVPTHPDSAGGLGFVEEFSPASSPFALAVSALLASHWAHDVVYHEVDVLSLKVPAGVFLAAVLLLCLGPLAVFIRPLSVAKRRALLDYGALVAEHGRLVRHRWILREPATDRELLGAPEIGPVADTISLYGAITSMRVIPFGRRAVLAIGAPALVPMLALFALEVPLKTVLLKILTTLA